MERKKSIVDEQCPRGWEKEQVEVECLMANWKKATSLGWWDSGKDEHTARSAGQEAGCCLRSPVVSLCPCESGHLFSSSYSADMTSFSTSKYQFLH